MSDPANKGGFVYMPGESKAGEMKKEEDDGAGLRSYGSMTYAGLKSMVYAKLNRDDPRVKAAMEWIQRHFTFAENPGLGNAGLYYYLHTCAKALAAYGDETVTDAAGKPRAWRVEFIAQAVGLQNPDGSWANENGRWMESVPELSTAYTVLALEAALNSAPGAK
jgi:squalene-hopene/tetraprenyl-beta-curcumene cyclase